MAFCAAADRDGDLCFGSDERAHCAGGKERNVHRREEDPVTLALQIVQANFRRGEHIRRFVVVVA